MNHTQMICEIKRFGFPVEIRKMTAFAFVEMKANEGNQKAIKCLQTLNEQALQDNYSQSN